MGKNILGVIGGSGFYNFLDEPESIMVETPFGKISVQKGKINEKIIIFLPRHGTNHTIPPHNINYKANIFALFKLGVTRILSSCAAGSTRKEIIPGSYVIPDQFIDPTFYPYTFFENGFSVTTKNGNKISGVVHTDMTTPYCSDIQKILQEILKDKENVQIGGTYAKLYGPRFETAAEVKMLALMGADLAGMTTVPELILARELGMCYGNLAIVTNYAAGLQIEVTHDEVVDLFKTKIEEVQSLFKETVCKIPNEKSCSCPIRE